MRFIVFVLLCSFTLPALAEEFSRAPLSDVIKNMTQGNDETRQAGEKLQSYYYTLNDYCEKDEDCAVRDIGNCCGTLPECVNKDATVDPDLVADLCQTADMLVVCGYKEVSGCACIAGTCEDTGVNTTKPVKQEEAEEY